MAKYRCIKKCFVFDTLFLENEIVDLQPDIKHKYLVPLEEAPVIEEREVKVEKPEGLDYGRMTETQLVNMDYPLKDLRERLEEDYQIVVPANMARRMVITKFVEARSAAER